MMRRSARNDSIVSIAIVPMNELHQLKYFPPTPRSVTPRAPRSCSMIVMVLVMTVIGTLLARCGTTCSVVVESSRMIA